MNRHITWQVIAGMLVAVLAVAATLAIVPIQSVQGQSHLTDHTLLLTLDRDRLALCVQPIADSGVTAPEIQALVQAALPALAQHPSWVPAGLAVAPPAVEVGCPVTPYLLQPGVSFDGKVVMKDGLPSFPQVVQASRFRVMVFVLPEGQTGKVFGSSVRRTITQESVCQGKVCSPVTTGLYLSPQELRDAQFLKAALERAIGLEPPVPFKAPSSPPQR